MVIGAFPAAKLGALLLRQISKPLANYLILQAKTSPVFRTYVCMPPAQFYNWCEVKTKMWILNLGKPVNIPVLNETMAIELGANLLGEAFIFAIAAGVLLAEYNRSARKEEAAQSAKQEEMECMKLAVQELNFQMEEQRTQIRELLRVLGHLDGKVSKASIRKALKVKSKPDDSPPEPPPTEIAPVEEKCSIVAVNPKPTTLNQAIGIFELEFLNNSNRTRELGVLSSALHYLFHDVNTLPALSS